MNAIEVYDSFFADSRGAIPQSLQAMAYGVLGFAECSSDYLRESAALLLASVMGLQMGRYGESGRGYDATRSLLSMTESRGEVSTADLLFLRVWSGFFYDPDLKRWTYDPTECLGWEYSCGAELYRAWRSLPFDDRKDSTSLVWKSLEALSQVADGEELRTRFNRELANIDSAPPFFGPAALD